MNATMTCAKRLLATLLVATATTTVTAQTANASPPSSLVGSWLVTIKGEPATRTFIVTEEASTANGALLKAAYGLSDTGQGPIVAEMRLVNDKRQLLFVTQADTKVSAIEQADGSFQGSFVIKSGRAMDVTITRFTEETKAQIAQAKALADMKAPGADVPAECAAFFGHWAGRWSQGQGNFGELHLRVAEVKAANGQCTARYSFASPPSPIPAPYKADIKNGELSFVCNRSTGGTCIFTVKGESTLYGSYSNPSGGVNNGVFNRIK